MINVLLLMILVGALILFLLFISVKETKLSKKTILLAKTICLTSILILFLYTGIGKIKAGISRLIHNSLPKDSKTVYSVLFGKPLDECVNVINFKDQVLPKIDCCIWMELQLCPSELQRIIASRNYTKSIVIKSDSVNVLRPYSGRPGWWNLQLPGDTIVKYNIVFDQDREQTLFVSPGNTHIYICDRAQ
ncbi:MAG: hypothetical protein V4717_20450 [Bacteroidota bacterium]